MDNSNNNPFNNLPNANSVISSFNPNGSVCTNVREQFSQSMNHGCGWNDTTPNYGIDRQTIGDCADYRNGERVSEVRRDVILSDNWTGSCN